MHVDFIECEFSYKDLLLIPIDRISLVQKYIGSLRNKSLDTLRSKAWGGKVKKAKRAAETTAREILSLYAQRKSAKGFQFKINNNETWDKILADGGSVQGLSELDGITMGPHDVPAKDVFKTFKEINQLELVNQAGIRQQYIDQSVSLNLAFPSVATPKWINQVHMSAWKKGIKTLYYTRTESVLRGDIAQQAMSEDCIACDG